MTSINPMTGEVFATYPAHSWERAEHAVEAAATAQREWRSLDFPARGAVLRRVAVLLRREAESLAVLAAREMGKPLEQGRSEVEKCAACCEYFADQAADFLADQAVESGSARHRVVFQPLGVLLAVMPWNFPFWQVIRAAAPALMAGNAVLLKHASNVSGCALALEAIFREAVLPDGLFTVLLVGSDLVERLIALPLLAAVTLTGSIGAGRSVARVAGNHLKKTVLELGGSDPYLVLEDADLDDAAETCAASRLINSGQSCIAAKRFIVAREVRKVFTEKLIERMSVRKMGDPLAAGTHIGPLARLDLRETLHEQAQRSLRAGAGLLLGGELPSGPGAFYPATVLTDVRPGMAAFDEETFGPLAAIIEAQDEDDAVALANRSSFGLGAAVFTKDLGRGEKIAARLEAGACYVNDLVRSDARLPFGGIKQSGYGRELGLFGIREFVNVKTISVK